MDISHQRIRLDPCRGWNIFDTRGHIFTDAKFWYVFVAHTSKHRWNNIMNNLDFMEVGQDGDEEA